MFNVTLKGFKTKEEAEEFISWYGNSGEQDFGDHLECQDDFDMSFASVDYLNSPQWDGPNYVTNLKMSYKGEE